MSSHKARSLIIYIPRKHSLTWCAKFLTEIPETLVIHRRKLVVLMFRCRWSPGMHSCTLLEPIQTGRDFATRREFRILLSYNCTSFKNFSNIRKHFSNLRQLVCTSCKIFIHRIRSVWTLNRVFHKEVFVKL